MAVINYKFSLVFLFIRQLFYIISNIRIVCRNYICKYVPSIRYVAISIYDM